MSRTHVIVLTIVIVAAAEAVIFTMPWSHTIEYVAQFTFAPMPSPTPQLPAVLLLGGDVMLSRSVGDTMARTGDWTFPFAHIASATRDADIMMVNLESVISDKGAVAGCAYCFRADPRALAGLTFAGVDIVSVANNHAWDYGPDAFSDSVTRLREAGIEVIGSMATASRSQEPSYRDIRGTRFAFLAYTNMLPVSVCGTSARVRVACYDATTMAADIARARAAADIVVVSFHSGDEYVPHNQAQETVYHAAIDAGADIVAGHHPHVVQDIQQYGRGWILYSLGNFVFDQAWSEPTMRGLMVRVTAQDGRITDVLGLPVRISQTYQVAVDAQESQQ